ncbi:hypothetical protein [Aeromonas sp. Y311-2]|uniref:hypothetical protein n=1 Tax=Aeromonas sp. Y311-2 TaxID=2990507 RepID=UPI0022E04F33|nr:hypothetical protein [Aeromonas sp. Y311-2]
MQNQEANSHPFSLGTAAVDNSPRRFPASLVPSMIRAKLSGSAIKVCVLVATDKAGLMKTISQAVISNPDMRRVASENGDAHIYRGTVQYQGSGNSNPCMVILAASQDDPAFRSAKFAAGGEPMQVIALHDGALAKGSCFEALVRQLCAEPMQLEGGL